MYASRCAGRNNRTKQGHLKSLRQGDIIPMLMADPQIFLCSVVDSSSCRRSTLIVLCSLCHCQFLNGRSASGSCRGVYGYISGKVKGSQSLVFSRFYPGQPNHLSTRPDPIHSRLEHASRSESQSHRHLQRRRRYQAIQPYPFCSSRISRKEGQDLDKGRQDQAASRSHRVAKAGFRHDQHQV